MSLNQPNRSEPASADAPSPSRGPVRSMTGYAHRSADTPLGRVTLELRSVNSRFTDLVFRLGDDVRTIEPQLREQITAVVSRGKIECRMQVRSRDIDNKAIQVSDALIANLAQAGARIRAIAPDAAPMTVADYLRWQMASSADVAGGADSGGPRADDGASGTPAAPADRLWPLVRPILDEVLADFLASREREGTRLAAMIVQQIEDMKQVVTRLRPMIPELLAGAQARLTARLEEAMPESTNAIPREETFARIRQEIALLSLRGDVTEEFDRLGIHFEEVLRAVGQGGAIGKRLDFLTQELNRESNTLASKASGVAVTDGAVSLKLLIEQMREQVQNIE